jgi:soluble lytic murein transglycosylase-like protein
MRPEAQPSPTNVMVAADRQVTPPVTMHQVIVPAQDHGPAAPTHWHQHIAHAHAVTGVPVSVLDAVMRQESGYRADARSPVGAIGLMQLMPETAAGLGVNPHDPAQNVLGGAKYLKQMYDMFGNWDSALAAYNAGPGALRPSRQNPAYQIWQAPYNTGYAETRNYVKTIKADIARRYGGIK